VNLVFVNQDAIVPQVATASQCEQPAKSQAAFLNLLILDKMKHYIFLLLAIGAEFFATASLKKANGFTVWLPSLLSVIGYAVSAYFLSAALKQIPIGIAYSVWASLGIVFSSLLGWLAYNQKLDVAGVAGIVMIVAGVICVSLFSKSIAH
jgi:small multidrug resistance pump